MDITRIIQEDLELLKHPIAHSITILHNGNPIALVNENEILPSASMGKTLLLLELAEQFAAGTVKPNRKVEILSSDRVGDSGLLQHLSPRHLTYNDLATLIATVSDNTATNTLIRTLGLETIQQRAHHLGLQHTNILDIIRDHRDPDIHAYAPSQATSLEYAHLIQRIHDVYGHLSINPGAAYRTKQWLAHNTDLSMVASALHLDPLSHHQKDNKHVTFFNKTGTDYGIRCDAGNITYPNGDNYTYSVFLGWEEETPVNLENIYLLLYNLGKLIAIHNSGQ